eukprot:gb/GEZN01014795.1/.p1 GENE.gb/GEZN01014795.1/~~gb/GEZN01014795.1/.p1  ORF type:complete len:169 (-),score=10.01 gb/GEZN01014795.1/:425-931(-)
MAAGAEEVAAEVGANVKLIKRWKKLECLRLNPALKRHQKGIPVGASWFLKCPAMARPDGSCAAQSFCEMGLLDTLDAKTFISHADLERTNEYRDFFAECLEMTLTTAPEQDTDLTLAWKKIRIFQNFCVIYAALNGSMNKIYSTWQSYSTSQSSSCHTRSSMTPTIFY